ncbi:MAG: MFS transporter [Alphaproteobacteria bacterium]
MTGDAPPGAGAGEQDPAQASGLAAFRHRDFLLYFFAKLFAMTAFHMVIVALGIQVWKITGNPMDLAYIGLTMFASAIGFALITGYVADRYDRRLVLAVCYLVMASAAVMFFLFAVSGTKVVWPVFLILVVYGTGRAFYMPASNALVPNLVPAELFPNAIAWNTTANKTTQIVGPALGGLLYELGPEVVYGTGTIIFITGALTMAMIKTRTLRGNKEPPNFKILLAGLDYVFNKKIVLGAITLDLFVVLMGGATALLPIYAMDILDAGASGAGFLRSAIAVGGVVTALLLTQITMTRGVGRILFASVTIFGLATIVFGISQWYVVSLIAMAILGAADMASVYIRQTLIQIATPDDMRGRVSAVNSVFVGTSNELGEFRAGVFAAWFGAVPAVVIGGIGAVAITGIFWKLFPELTRVERLDRALT